MKNRENRADHYAEHPQDGQRNRHQHHNENRARPDERGSGRRSGRGHHEKGRGGHRDRRRGKRGRARRGEARYILLDVLRDGPKHGYEMIKALEERSAGQYVPSPGTVYPTLQYLEDQGFVRAEQDAERRVYHLTETGTAELEMQAAAVADFWSQFEPLPTGADQPEVRFLEEELEHLNRIVWNGLREALVQDNQPLIRQVREVVEACQTQVRQVITSQGRADGDE
ncbi:MAG: PadR family transcriptional regulator [Caldilineaceae bacterium]